MRRRGIVRTAGLVMVALCATTWAGCLTSERFRARAGKEMCDWVYYCELAYIIEPLEDTYGFDDEKECREWFEDHGPAEFDGEYVVHAAEEDESCEFDSDEGHDMLDVLEDLECEDLTIRDFVEVGADLFAAPYADCYPDGGVS